MGRWLLLVVPILLFAADYDVIVIGSSPTSLFEALHQHALGKKVLVLEASPLIGGAWQTIDTCGVPHADLGCHLIGLSQELADFFSAYAGCKIVPLDTPKIPDAPFGKNGFYFSKGCFELIDHLQRRIARSTIDFRFNQLVHSGVIDEENGQAIVKTADKQFSAEKIFLTPYTYFPEELGEAAKNKLKFHHLYLLVYDPNPVKFTYSFGIPHTTRMMNVTDFVDLDNTGMQLIILQTHDEDSLNKSSVFLSKLKEKNLIDESAYIVKSESYTYHQWPSHNHVLSRSYPKYFEILDTHNLINMTKYISRWKESLTTYKEAVPQ